VQKKEKDRVLHENVLDVQDPCFFLGNSSLGAFARQYIFWRFNPDLRILQHFRLRLVLLSDLWFSDAL
jgi:hypothetical protein